jgi:glycosyltransferase involved in cell wall biosynthesis
MKILFFIESLRSGGKERRLLELIKGLSKFPDIEMELVLTREDIHYTEIFDTSIKIHYAIRKGLKKDPRVFWQFYKIAKQFKPDIIHVWGNMVAIYAIPSKEILRVPMINNQITDAPLKVKGGMLSYSLTFLFSDKIIANTYAGLKSYNAPTHKSKVIYNGFDFVRLNKLESKEYIKDKFKIKTKFIVGMIASFSDKKDYASYIKVANIILAESNDVTFLCVGSGDDAAYRKLVNPSNIDKILFLGAQQNVESIMNICDLGVLTSNIRVHGEGISNSLLEFSSLSKPILATDNGGTPEIIEDRTNGFLLIPFNREDLTNKINLLLGDDKLRFEMGAKAKAIVLTKFGIEKMTNEFYNEYKLTINKIDGN